MPEVIAGIGCSVEAVDKFVQYLKGRLERTLFSPKEPGAITILSFHIGSQYFVDASNLKLDPRDTRPGMFARDITSSFSYRDPYNLAWKVRLEHINHQEGSMRFEVCAEGSQLRPNGIAEVMLARTKLAPTAPAGASNLSNDCKYYSRKKNF